MWSRAVRRSISETLPGASEAILDGLMKAWSEVQGQLLQLYQRAAESYFTYLHKSGGAAVDDVNIMATLRLLRLLVRHGVELQDTLTDGFESTPSSAWQLIVPQLFARLSHPSAYVQDQVLHLLQKISKDAPHQIVYPAVVGTDQADDNSKESDGTKDDAMGVARSSDEAFYSIKRSLIEHSPEIFDQVQEMITQLRRITVLWDELWLGTLQQKQADVVRRIQRLKNEHTRLVQNDTLDQAEKRRLVLEKHDAIMKPVLVVVEDLRRRTYGQIPVSPHEEAFRKTYGPMIDAGIEELRTPSRIPYDADAVWEPFKTAGERLKENSKRKLSLENISPTLAARQASAISMPGVSFSDPLNLVTIQSFRNDVLILPSKTKPKKLSIVGSDGRQYAFLFKGLEDLHLDERIMQFLDIVNVTFAKGARSGSKFRARSYNVIPIGARSGLIQWVDGAVPAFSLYNKWQYREYVKKAERDSAEKMAQKAQQGPGAPVPPEPDAKPSGPTKITLPRPSETFYKKLTPALKERGITNLAARSKWPRDGLSRVFGELLSETPSDLISREMWMYGAFFLRYFLFYHISVYMR